MTDGDEGVDITAISRLDNLEFDKSGRRIEEKMVNSPHTIMQR